MKCPECQNTLVANKHPNGATWQCCDCSRSYVNMAVLRKRLDPETVRIIWQQSDTAQLSSRHCPSCSRQFRLFSETVSEHRITLEVCRLCQLICFDHERLSLFRQEVPEDTLSLEARKAIARCRIELDRRCQAVAQATDSTLTLTVECILIILDALGSLT